jgi:co-chaperonin GroES (HSP10)
VHGAPKVRSIHLPEAVRERHPGEAVVVAIGPANQLPIEVGSRVYTARFNGTMVKSGERVFRLLEPEDLLAIVTT